MQFQLLERVLNQIKILKSLIRDPLLLKHDVQFHNYYVASTVDPVVSFQSFLNLKSILNSTIVEGQIKQHTLVYFNSLF